MSKLEPTFMLDVRRHDPLSSIPLFMKLAEDFIDKCSEYHSLKLCGLRPGTHVNSSCTLYVPVSLPDGQISKMWLEIKEDAYADENGDVTLQVRERLEWLKKSH